MIITNHRGKSILRGGARHTPTRNYGPSKLYDGRLPSLVRKMRVGGGGGGGGGCGTKQIFNYE